MSQIMKIKYINMILLMFGWGLTSCQYDNYEAPNSMLAGMWCIRESL